MPDAEVTQADSVANSSAHASPAPPLNPLSLTTEELVRLLSAAGGRKVDVARVQADLEAGAPVGSGGRINLVHFTAWLLREVQTSGD